MAAASISSASAVQFPCRQCGADLTFEPGTQSLTCPYCGHEETVQASSRAIVEYELSKGIEALAKARADELQKGGVSVRCDGCGAIAVVDTQAQRCTFCDSPTVSPIEDDQPMVMPESLLPFQVQAKVAHANFLQWVQSRWFAPNDLGKKAKGLELRGVYLPYWTFDSQTETDYVGYRGDHYYVTEYYTDSQGNRQSRTVQRTRWTSASGHISRFFDDVLVPASTSLEESLAQALGPWDLGALEPFAAGYLSGFVAERYQLPLEDGFEQGKEIMSVAIESSVRMDIGGDVQRISSQRTSHHACTFKHLLLPVWLSSYRYSDKVYQFAVNAQTGEVVGRRPYSWVKITLAVLAGVGFVALMFWLNQRYG